MRYKTKLRKPVLNDFTILYDDREKKHWSFLSEKWMMERTRLKVGDYTIKDFEDKIAIEKKSGIAELITDLSAANRKTFERFLKKLSVYPVKCIIVEQPLTNPGIYSTINILNKKSKGKLRLNAFTIFYWTAVILIEYNIPIIFTDVTSSRQIIPVIFEAAYQKALKL
jgi:ERCC4-type nuclease